LVPRTRLDDLHTLAERGAADLKHPIEGRVFIDFEGVALVSSSFADEVFGKLIVELGAMTFMQRFELKNVHSMVRALVDKAIAQRTSVTAS
jgi:hypothetical protein